MKQKNILELVATPFISLKLLTNNLLMVLIFQLMCTIT